MALPSSQPSPHDKGLPAPRVAGPQPLRFWRANEITPTHLSVFRTCPYQFRLQYIERVTTPWRYEHTLSQGRIAHGLLADAGRRLQHGATLLRDIQLEERARRAVPVREMPSPEAHDAAVREILEWVAAGIRYLRRDPDGAMLLVEGNQKRAFPGDLRISVSFRPDVVRWSADADGEFIEVIDYKTGKPRVDPCVPVISRFVINPLLEDRLGRIAWGERVWFTYVWLRSNDATSIELDRRTCQEAWAATTDLIERLLAEAAWEPTPSPLCRWCRFYRVACDAGDLAHTRSPGLLFGGPGDLA